jgi:hypothetical protein
VDQPDSDELETKILKKIYVWMVVGGIAIGGVGGSGIMRTDKFGESDFVEHMANHLAFESVQHQALKHEILREIDALRKTEEAECQVYRQAIWERIIRLEEKQKNISELQQGVLKELKERGIVSRK